MDRDQLTRWLDQGLSLSQIGAIVSRDPSTVAYWVRKHGLVANGHAKHAAKGGLPRDELTALVSAGETLAAIAEAFEVSMRTVRYWIERYGLPRPHSVRRTELERALEEGRRTLFRDCSTHGWTVFVIENSGRARCRASPRGARGGVASADQGEVGRGGRWPVPPMRLQPLSGGAAVPPPRSGQEVVRAVAARRYEIVRGNAL